AARFFSSSRRAPTPRPPLFPYTTLFRSPAAAGWNRMPASVTVTAPVVWQASVMAVPGDGEAGGVAVNEVILGGGITSFTATPPRSEEHTSELQSRFDLVCRLLLEKKKKN